MKTRKLNAQVAVIGAGSAGVAAAVAAARSGAEVILVEKQSYPGGSATAAMVGTVCGLFLSHPDDTPKWAAAGFMKSFAIDLMNAGGTAPEKFYERLHFLPYPDNAFKTICNRLLKAHNITCLWHTSVRSVQLNEGRVESLQLFDGAAEIELTAGQVVDCTGDSWVSRLANETWVNGGDNQAAARVFKLCGIADTPADAIHFALSLALRRGVNQGHLPSELGMLSVVPGSYRNQCAYFKLPLPEVVSNDPVQRAEMLNSSEQQVKTVVDFLRNRVKSFANAELVEIAPEVGFRTGYRPQGREILTEKMVLETRKFPDGIANGAWPIENWKPGANAELKFFADGDYYQVPSGCLESAHAGNLYFAGRNISAEPSALASARVMGICLQTGYAAGMLAAGAALEKNRTEVIAQLRAELELKR